MATKITKSELKNYIKEVLREELTEARKANPKPPATLDIVRIEPRIQKNYGDQRGTVRHSDIIIYMDPIFGRERRQPVYEEDPGFGKYFGWGDKHSVDGWNFAAYDYEGNLLPNINPSAHISAAHKKTMSSIVDKVNNPSDYDEEEELI